MKIQKVKDERYLCPVGFRLFLATSLLELHTTHVHDRSGDLVNIVLLLLGEAQHVEGLLSLGENN